MSARNDAASLLHTVARELHATIDDGRLWQGSVPLAYLSRDGLVVCRVVGPNDRTLPGFDEQTFPRAHTAKNVAAIVAEIERRLAERRNQEVGCAA